MGGNTFMHRLPVGSNVICKISRKAPVSSEQMKQIDCGNAFASAIDE